MWKKVILAIAVLVVCGIGIFFVFRNELEKEEGERKRNEAVDFLLVELDWSESVLTPKSGNPKVFFDKFTFEHGLFHSVDGVYYDTQKRVGNISTRVWNDSKSTISQCHFFFTLIDAKTKKEIWRPTKGFVKNVTIPPNSTRGVTMAFVMPMEMFEGIEDWKQELVLYKVKREQSKYGKLFDREFEPLKNIPLH
jgi:hypothetical protein